MDMADGSSTPYLSSHVRDIASLVYSEFERLVSRYGEGVVDGIVPIMIRTLEQVDQLHEANELLKVSATQMEIELESAVSRLESEIRARRAAEEVIYLCLIRGLQQLMVLEDELAEVKVQMNKRVAEFARTTHALEARCVNAYELASRQEAKVAELQRDLANAQTRCNDLLCSHVAHIERSRNRLRSLMTEESRHISYSIDTPHPIPEESLNYPPRMEPIASPALSKEFTKLQYGESSFDGAFLDHEDETTDYEAFLGDQLSTKLPLDDPDDPVSRALEKEVKKLVAENQELLEMKNALNVLKDDLLSRIDDLCGENAIVKKDLDICRDELFAERKRAKQRERLLMQRNQRLTSQLHLNERLIQSKRARVPMRSFSLNRPGQEASVSKLHRRVHSCPAALPALFVDWTPAADSQLSATPKEVPGSGDQLGSLGGAADNSGKQNFSKQEISRVILERNYYKERFIEAYDRLRALEIDRSQVPIRRPRKREMVSAFFTGIFEKVQSFANDVAQGLDELVTPLEERHPPPTQHQIRTSTALWNLLGNFVGQAVTYTADVVIGTGNDLPLDVSRRMIAANVDSKLPMSFQHHSENRPV
uniref:RH1 domain-containing protein n=1 Tax=Mesocestoides corti TaxID=53468 RepID=A0A5K3EUA9_MESCO